MNTRGTNNPARHFSSDKQVATGIIMMRLGYWQWGNVYMCVCVYIQYMSAKSIRAGRSRCVCLPPCACMPLWVCVCNMFSSVCILCFSMAHCSRAFTVFNDWTHDGWLCAMGFAVVDWGSQGHAANICFPPWQQVDSQSGLYFCHHCWAGIMMCWLRGTTWPRYLLLNFICFCFSLICTCCVCSFFIWLKQILFMLLFISLLFVSVTLTVFYIRFHSLPASLSFNPSSLSLSSLNGVHYITSLPALRLVKRCV